MNICNQDHVKLKSYFYALRTALAGRWIIEKNTFPPVDFLELLPIAPTNIQEKVLELMALKANQDEKYLHPKDILIIDYLRKTVLFNQKNASSLKSGKKMNEELDGVFRGLI